MGQISHVVCHWCVEEVQTPANLSARGVGGEVDSIGPLVILPNIPVVGTRFEYYPGKVA